MRTRLARATAGIATAETRLRQIDAAPHTPASTQQRETIAATLDRLRQDARDQSDALTRLLTQVRAAQVPEEWTQ
ncbi:MAG: hypothetical protein O2930_03070 [Acidobacteria bacterium]|nr:hypothetical protein [Acidobacteriota bacterium]